MKMELKISNPKRQITNKPQIQIFKIPTLEALVLENLFEILIFEHWDFFVICFFDSCYLILSIRLGE